MKMAKRILLIMLAVFMIISNASAFKLYFEEGDRLVMNEAQNPITLHLTIDNRIAEAGEYISPNSELSYLELKKVGENENLVYIVNEKDYEGTGKHHEKEFVETIEIQLKLPTTEKWKKEYEVQIAGVAPDGRQEIGKIIVEPTGENVETPIDKINLKYLIFGVVGLITILLIVFLVDKYWKKEVKY